MDAFEHAFDNSKSSSFMNSMDDSSFSYGMDSGLGDYLQYPPQSPTFSPMSLPGPSSSPTIGFNNLNLPEYTYSPHPYTPETLPARPYTPPDGASISPPALIYHMSAGEMSSDGTATSGRHSRGSGTHSPATASVSRIPYAATVPRSQRFNPISVPSPRTRSTAKVAAAARRRRSRNEESDEEDDDFEPTPASASAAAGGSSDSRREFIRRQRIESEQRRRDDLRDGYARLKDILPPSNQKASKASLLERATCHLRHLESCKATLENNLANTEAEVRRLRDVNERLMLGTAEHRRATAAASSSSSSSTLVPALSF